jgi:hypothetical protein
VREYYRSARNPLDEIIIQADAEGATVLLELDSLEEAQEVVEQLQEIGFDCFNSTMVRLRQQE